METSSTTAGGERAHDAAETPEDVLLQDRWLQFAGGAWLVVFALGVHAAR